MTLTPKKAVQSGRITQSLRQSLNPEYFRDKIGWMMEINEVLSDPENQSYKLEITLKQETPIQSLKIPKNLRYTHNKEYFQDKIDYIYQLWETSHDSEGNITKLEMIIKKNIS